MPCPLQKFFGAERVACVDVQLFCGAVWITWVKRHNTANAKPYRQHKTILRRKIFTQQALFAVCKPSNTALLCANSCNTTLKQPLQTRKAHRSAPFLKNPNRSLCGSWCFLLSKDNLNSFVGQNNSQHKQQQRNNKLQNISQHRSTCNNCHAFVVHTQR